MLTKKDYWMYGATDEAIKILNAYHRKVKKAMQAIRLYTDEYENRTGDKVPRAEYLKALKLFSTEFAKIMKNQDVVKFFKGRDLGPRIFNNAIDVLTKFDINKYLPKN